MVWLKGKDGDSDNAPLDLWLHIGCQYLNPYRPTFQAVQPVADPQEAEAILTGLEIVQAHSLVD